jgi:hypothetical protein
MLKYEDVAQEINELLEKKRGRWRLDQLHYIDYDDIKQIICKHIWVKWPLWDQQMPLGPWINKVADSQIKNLIRNHWGKVAAPCNNSCVHNMGEDRCAFTPSGKKCAECPLYKKWEKKKKDGYGIKFAFSIDEILSNGGNIVGSSEDNFDMQKSLEAFHVKMKEALPEKLYKIYEIIYINNESEVLVSKMLGLQNNEKSSNAKRAPGYKIIFIYKQQIFEIAKEVIKDFDLIKQ